MNVGRNSVLNAHLGRPRVLPWHDGEGRGRPLRKKSKGLAGWREKRGWEVTLKGLGWEKERRGRKNQGREKKRGENGAEKEEQDKNNKK